MVKAADQVLRRKPQRTCIICRGTFLKETLTRYVFEDSDLTADARQVMDGRGCYCCSSASCLSQMDLSEKRLKQVFRLSK